MCNVSPPPQSPHGSERLETVVNFSYEKHFRYSKVPDSGISSSSTIYGSSILHSARMIQK